MQVSMGGKAACTATCGCFLVCGRMLSTLDGMPKKEESVDLFLECKGSIDRGDLPKSHDCLGIFDATGDEGDSMMHGRLTRLWLLNRDMGPGAAVGLTSVLMREGRGREEDSFCWNSPERVGAMTAEILRLRSPLLLGLVNGSPLLESQYSSSGVTIWRPRCIDRCMWSRAATSGWFLAIATVYGVDPYYCCT